MRISQRVSSDFSKPWGHDTVRWAQVAFKITFGKMWREELYFLQREALIAAFLKPVLAQGTLDFALPLFRENKSFQEASQLL